MTLVVPAKIRWIVLAGETEAVHLLEKAALKTGFKFQARADGFLVEIPRSRRKRQPGASLAGLFVPAEWGTQILWDCGTDTGRTSEQLLDLEAAFPTGKLQYHGMVEASAAAGIVFDGIRAFRAVASHLYPDERVLALGQGRAHDDPCIVVLTDRRLLTVGGTSAEPPHLDAPLESIGALRLGKKRSGETLQIGSPSGAALISHLGHGEGHAIVAGFRLRIKELARTSPLPPAGVPGDTSADDGPGRPSAVPRTRSADNAGEPS